LLARWRALLDELAACGSAVVAYSGGVDSSFLAYAARLALGERMVAVTIASAVDPSGMQENAARFAAQLGFRQEVLALDLLGDPDFRANPPERCYYCKTIILRELWAYARAQEFATVIEGQNADDEADYRPGRKAVSETGTHSPLAHNGFSKAEIRRLAKALGLPVWDQPSSPCLATRIPYGTAITAETLAQISHAEDYLHERGFRVVRVRSQQGTARIEVEPGQIPRLVEIRGEVVCHFKEIGFHAIALDLQGYRQGSLNEGLSL
jgi:uncharacterized protein